MADYIIPDDQVPKQLPKPIIKEIRANEVKGQALQVLKGMGLPLLKQRFLTIDVSRAEEEDSANQPGVGIYNYDKKSIFGLPVFDTITLNGLTYEDFEGKTVTLSNFTLDIALVEVTNPRNIIRTPVSGRNGTIKEYMSDDDSVIKINGSLLSNRANIPPEALVRSLYGFCQSQKEIAVNSTVMSYLGIVTIVIAESRFIQRVGARDVIDYELTCYSETPFELKDAAT